MAAQAAGLRLDFPFGETVLTRFGVMWRGTISPNKYSRRYDVELQYEQGDSPHVWVRQPNLRELAGERRLPHVYDQVTQELCLYLPGVGLWNSEKALTRTVLPWAILWLYYFEIWLVTNVWHGRGEHPDRRKNRTNRHNSTADKIPLL